MYLLTNNYCDAVLSVDFGQAASAISASST